jgi:hypothetical protein
MSFLKKEVESEERITMAFQGFSFGNSIRGTKPQKMEPSSSNKNIPTTAGLVNFKPSKKACVFCSWSHSSDALKHGKGHCFFLFV